MTKAGQLWGGRFTEKPNETFVEFNNSFRFDLRLIVADVRASIAHANALEGAGVLKKADAAKIRRGLKAILKRADTADFFESDAEDVHSFIEGKLVELIGDAGKKLHTGRSRNDQVATAFRLWLRYAIDEIREDIRSAQAALIRVAERHKQERIDESSARPPARLSWLGKFTSANSRKCSRAAAS